MKDIMGKPFFHEDAINEIFPDVYDAAVKETGIEPVDSPMVDIIQIGGGKDLILTAEVDVKPETKLGQYKGIEITKVEKIITEKDVEHQLEHVREDNARLITIEDRGVKNGDMVTFDFAGTINGEPFDGGAAEGYTLEIGRGQFIPGFEEQMIGMNLEEEKDITITFPKEYHVEDLREKEAVFHVKIHEIKEKELPVLDDEFAKDVSEFDTLEEYKEDLKRKLKESADQDVRTQMENQLLEIIRDNAEVDIPEVMIEKEADNLMREMEMQMRLSGFDLETFLKMTNTSIDDYRAQYRDRAYNRVKTQLVLEAISKAENITVTEEDREKEYERLAKVYNSDIENIKKTFSANQDIMDNSILMQKTIDMLMEEAILVEKESSENESSDVDKEGHVPEEEKK
ncbi:MAG: trigger factor [Caldicoprobacterales bacterium]